MGASSTSKDVVRASLWRMPVDNGTEVRVVDSLHQPAGVSIVDDGVYFSIQGETSSNQFIVRFLNAHTGNTRDVATLSGPLGWGLSMAPDRRSLLFVKVQAGGFDLMLTRLVR